MNILNKLRLSGIKICTIGNKLNQKNIKNFGYVSNQKVKKILKLSRATLSSAENLFSIFNIESINHNLNIFFDLHLSKYNSPKYTPNLIPIDFKKDAYLKIIKKNLKQSKKNYKNYRYEKNLILLKKNFDQFIKNYF